MNSTASLEALCLLFLKSGCLLLFLFLSYSCFLLYALCGILWLLDLVVIGFLCVQACTSLCLYVFLVFFSLAPFLVFCHTVICLFLFYLYFILFCFYSSDTYLFSKERWKERRSKWERQWRETGKIRGGKTVIRTYCMKKNLSSIKEKNNFRSILKNNLYCALNQIYKL